MTELERRKLAEVRANYDWASNFTDQVLLIMIRKNPNIYDLEPTQYFKYGMDPITGKVIPAMATWSMPVIGILLAIGALFFVSRMR